MSKMILAFFVLFGISYMGIEIFRAMTGKEKLQALKTFSYSVAISLLVIVMLTIFVVLF